MALATLPRPPNPPTVFVLDWDGTIAGRVDYQSQRYSLQQVLRKHGYSYGNQKASAVPAAFQPGHGLIRPYLVDFINTVRRMTDDNCYFFIYTASERRWATQEIAWVEQTHGIRFARPIFARDNCIVDSGGNYRKSLKKIWPRILRVVTKNYPMTMREKEHMLHRRTVLIDNNAVYVDYTDKLLLCPDYNYLVFENLLDALPPPAMSHPVIRQHLLSLANDGLLCPSTMQAMQHTGGGGSHHVPPIMKRMYSEYRWLSAKCQSVIEANAAYERDEFWHLLRKLLIKNSIRDYPPDVVAQLQHLIWKRYRTDKHCSMNAGYSGKQKPFKDKSSYVEIR